MMFTTRDPGKPGRRLRIALLGPFDVSLDGVPVTRFTYTKVRGLLAYLAIEADRPPTRAHLAALLWPDVPERVARQNLSQALAILRDILGDRDQTVLGAAYAQSVPFLLVTSDTIQMNPMSDHMVDVKRFAQLLAGVEAHQHRGVHLCAACIDQLSQAVALYRGDLLADLPTIDSELFDEWAQALREHLYQQVIGALERLARSAEWHQHYDAAIRYARELRILEPEFEASHQDLARLLALAGQSTPLPSAALPQSPVAQPGRARELGEVCAQLQAAMGRLLTLVGAPGSGKTALALEAARVLRFDFADGVYVVDLTSPPEPTQPGDPAGLLPAIAKVVAVPSPVGPDLIDRLTAFLRPRHLLLILDGFERVLDTAPAVAALLAACPDVCILVTSRAPLRVRAESRYYLS